jgi:hypothetical protein
MSFCFDITDAAFVHLRGIHTLNMNGCEGITDAAFVHLRGIHTLYMRGCDGITDAAFVHLRGIHSLDLKSCEQLTGAAIENLGCSLEFLYISLYLNKSSVNHWALEIYGVQEGSPKVKFCNIPQGAQGGKRKIKRKTRVKRTKRRTRKLLRD